MTQKLSGTMIMFICLLIPIFGCIMAVTQSNISWLVLLAPLMIFMEGGILLIGLAIVIVAYLISS